MDTTRTYTAYKSVAETHDVTENYTVMEAQHQSKEETYQVRVPVTRTVEQQYQVSVPVWRDVAENYAVRVPETKQEERQYQVRVAVPRQVEQQYTVMVPHTETQTGARQVCRTVSVTTYRTVCRDAGHWESCVVTAYSGCCGTCDSCCGHQTVTQRRWVPNIVQQQIPCTTYRQEVSSVPYEYQVTVHRPEVRTRTVTVNDYKMETRSQTVNVTHYRTEKRTRNRKVCEYEV